MSSPTIRSSPSRQPDVLLPNFDALAQLEHPVFSDLRHGEMTEKVLPALFLGKPVVDLRKPYPALPVTAPLQRAPGSNSINTTPSSRCPFARLDHRRSPVGTTPTAACFPMCSIVASGSDSEPDVSISAAALGSTNSSLRKYAADGAVQWPKAGSSCVPALILPQPISIAATTPT